MRPRRPALLLTVLAVVAAACGGPGAGGDGGPDVAAPRDPAPSADASAPATPREDGASGDPAAVPEALDFVAPAVDGGQVRGAAYAGGDVVLWMWAPW